VEREVAQPLARRLSGIAPGAATLAEFTEEGGAFQLRLREIRPVPRSVWWPEQLASHPAAELLEKAGAALDRIERSLESNAPRGSIELTSLRPEQAHYFHCREQLLKVERIMSAVENLLAARRGTGSRPMRTTRPKSAKIVLRQTISGNPGFDRQREVETLRHDIAELSEPETIELPDSPVAALVRELALMDVVAATSEDQSCGVILESDGSLYGISGAQRMARQLNTYFSGLCGIRCEFTAVTPHAEDAILNRIIGEPFVMPGSMVGLFLSGPNARTLANAQIGNVLVRTIENEFSLVRIGLCNVASLGDLQTKVESGLGISDPLHDELISLTRTLDLRHGLTDHSTGLVIGYTPKPEEIRALFLSALPLPPEFDI
jgi:hypothetical protein